MLKLFHDRSETIEGVGEALRAGKTSCVEVLQGCLDRIKEWEPKVKAWVVIDVEGAREQARILDDELTKGTCRGPLHGIPFGIKDIIDVKGLPTACGFDPWRNRIADADSHAVNNLRDSGAIILGKTVTTQFAWIDPPVTRNPWNLERTPGGSSSGSAVAVTTGMCFAALGTQTGGSVIRPASFCGVVGYKFEHDNQMMEGIQPFAISLDHLGIFARTTKDIAHVASRIRCPSALRKAPSQTPSLHEMDHEIEDRDHFGEIDTEIRLLRIRGFFDRRADPEAIDAIEQAAEILEDAGADIIDLDPAAEDFEGILRDHRSIMAVQAASVHESRFLEAPDKFSKHIRALIEEGLSRKVTTYAVEREALADRNRRARALFSNNAHAILTPATIGPAPDLSTTGNPCMNSPWSYFGLPVLSIPFRLSHEGLPLSIQLTGPLQSGGRDDFLPVAAWCEAAIRRAHSQGSD